MTKPTDMVSNGNIFIEMPKPVSWWVGRQVRRTDTKEDHILGDATVLAVDDTAYRPSAWIKYHSERMSYPSYRSIDLCDLEDAETGETGPCWGTGGYEADAVETAARIQAAQAGT